MKALLLGLWLLGSLDDTQGMRERLLREERALLEAKQEFGTLGETLKGLAEEKAAALARLDELGAARVTLETERRLLREQEIELAAGWEKQRERAAQRLVMLARSSEAGALELLLTSGGPADFVYRFHALQSLARQDRRLFEDLRDRRRELDSLRERYEAQGLLLNDLERRGREEIERLVVLEQLRSEQSERLLSEVKEREAWVASLRDSAAELGVMVRELEPVRRKGATRQTFLMPVAGSLVARFGAPDPLAGNLLPSEGWRFRAPAGEPVSAAGAGTVTFADWFQGFGNLVIIDHGDELSTLYAHLDTIDVQAGAAVEGGQAVGTAGTSGTLHEPGLYFQVRRKGAAADPAAFFAADSR